MDKINLENKTILVTGTAGFIGSYLCQRLLRDYPAAVIIGLDNVNDYYDVRIKEYRLKQLENGNFIFIRGDLSDKALIDKLFADYKPQVAVNLAAQAGVRYSITNPDAYLKSNLIGFFNILEACRNNMVEHLVLPSSSVYGSNSRVPYSTDAQDNL